MSISERNGVLIDSLSGECSAEWSLGAHPPRLWLLKSSLIVGTAAAAYFSLIQKLNILMLFLTCLETLKVTWINLKWPL